MTLQFPYNTKDKPSSLILDLEIWNESGRSTIVKGKIDTGSDYTVIPESAAQELGLKRTGGKIIIRTANEQTIECNRYFVSVQIGHIKFERLRVITMPKDYALIGRDLINLWKLELDGKSKIYTIEPWSTNPEDVN